MNRSGTTALFLFDHNVMDSSYGYQAFKAIYDCLKSCTGVCAFNDGDTFSSETLDQLQDFSKSIKPAGEKSVLKTKDFSSIGPYMAAMWTDENKHVTTLHACLLRHSIPGYQGVMRLDGSPDYGEFLGFCHSLGLPQCISLRDGDIIKGTAKYGIGVRSEDAKLLLAASNGDLSETVKAIQDGANVECIDSHDRVSTPLFLATVEGHADIVRLLLKHGADPDASNGSNTALMIASRFGQVDVVKALIEGGVDVGYTNPDGYGAFDEAEDFPEILELLKNASSIIQWSARSKSNKVQYNANDHFPLPTKYKEESEDRLFSHFKELPIIDKFVEEGDLKGAWKACEQGLSMYPDSFLFYMRAGKILTKLGDVEQAQTILLEGLNKSKSKCYLATQLGDMAMQANMPWQTLKWWLSSCNMQLEADLLLYSMPFMNISYVCHPLGLSEESDWFQEMANRAQSFPIQFNTNGAEKRYQIARGLITSGLDEAIYSIQTVYNKNKENSQHRRDLDEEAPANSTVSHNDSGKNWWQFWK